MVKHFETLDYCEVCGVAFLTEGEVSSRTKCFPTLGWADAAAVRIPVPNRWEQDMDFESEVVEIQRVLKLNNILRLLECVDTSGEKVWGMLNTVWADHDRISLAFSTVRNAWTARCVEDYVELVDKTKVGLVEQIEDIGWVS